MFVKYFVVEVVVLEGKEVFIDGCIFKFEDLEVICEGWREWEVKVFFENMKCSGVCIVGGFVIFNV